MNSLYQYIKSIFVILTIIFLFPKYARASGMEGLGVLLIFGPLIIVCVNFGKFLCLLSNKELKLSFISFLYVAITELFLLFFGYYPILVIVMVLKLAGIDAIRIFESHRALGIYAQAISYGVLATFPNLFLLREKEQTFIQVLKSPSKILRAAILAFIIPIIFYTLMYFAVT